MSSDKINKSSNRSFGILFFFVFLIIALFPLINNDEIIIWSLIAAFIFLILGLTNSIFLQPLNYLWFQFGLLLGTFVAPLVMVIIYFAVVFPTFLILKIFKKNYLGIKYDKNKTSYWIDITDNKSNMKDQF
tara:strand:- start:1975 stop:2367 length:393 start_codon:yes stop_codon:yes gene_type:complete